MLRRKLDDKLEQADLDKHRNARLNVLEGQVNRLQRELREAKLEQTMQWAHAQEQYEQTKVYAERLNDVQNDKEALTSRNLELHNKVRQLERQLQLVATNQALLTSSSSDWQ